MKTMKSVLPKAGMIFLIFTLLCGVIYTGVVTGIAQLIFPDNANGSIIEVDGKKYGCELLGQQYTDEAHMWGRIMNIDVSTYTDENGKALMYAAPSNLSPASEEYAQLVAERVEKLRAADPDMDETAIPVDLVTCSGSGLDPHISPAAAEYQVVRIAKANDMTEDEVREIIQNCTDGRFLGIFGEETVNVLEVNLMLDGILVRFCCPMVTPLAISADPSHSANSSGYVYASIVAAYSSTDLKFKYLISSAYNGDASAPDGLSVMDDTPFQAMPFGYVPPIA